RRHARPLPGGQPGGDRRDLGARRRGLPGGGRPSGGGGFGSGRRGPVEETRRDGRRLISPQRENPAPDDTEENGKRAFRQPRPSRFRPEEWITESSIRIDPARTGMSNSAPPRAERRISVGCQAVPA